MIISEKQIMSLIITVKHFTMYLQEKQDFNVYGKSACQLLDEIREQQSEELKVIE